MSRGDAHAGGQSYVALCNLSDLLKNRFLLLLNNGQHHLGQLGAWARAISGAAQLRQGQRA
jgi:hypothetical protein